MVLLTISTFSITLVVENALAELNFFDGATNKPGVCFSVVPDLL